MPPPGHEPFLRAICENPEEDTVRLVYADWLDENADADGSAPDRARAEFIRLQILRAQLKAVGEDTKELKTRDIKLRAMHEDRWRRELPFAVRPETWQRFWRGFVSGTTTTARYYLRHANTLFAAAPVQFVHIKELTDGLAPAFAASEYLRRVHGLTLSFSSLGDGWRSLFSGGNLVNLRWLEVRSFSLTEFTAQAIARASLPALARIHVRGTVTRYAEAVLRTRFGVNATWEGMQG